MAGLPYEVNLREVVLEVSESIETEFCAKPGFPKKLEV